MVSESTPLVNGAANGAANGDDAASFPPRRHPYRQSRSSAAITRAWTFPWIVLFAALYAYALPWMYIVIFDQYLIRRSWEELLPGLGETLALRVCMGSHMTFGAMSLLIGPTQFLSAFRRTAPSLHRWCGRAYIASALACSAFGEAFIALKGGRLVGGANMAVAFALSGVAFGGTSAAAYVEARAGRWESHRNWTVRSFSQVLSPMLYRYWYYAVDRMGLHPLVSYDPTTDCDPDTGICPSFLRLFDVVHCWTYWLTALAVAEWIVWMLPPLREEEGEGEIKKVEGDEEQLFMERDEASNGGAVRDRMDVVNGGSSFSVRPLQGSATGLNVLGVVLATIASIITVLLYTPKSA